MVKHRIRGRKFGRKTKHRIALKRNLVAALIEHGRIVTTLPKAKEYRPHAEKLVSLARSKTLHNVRNAARDLHRKDLLKKLFDEIGPRFADRPGGYLRIRKLAKPRLGDAAPRAILEFVDHVPPRPVSPDAETEEKGKAAKPKRGKGKAAAHDHDEHDHAHDHGHDHGEEPKKKKPSKKKGKASGSSDDE
jgi:large subunit ribosomal protein L17